MSLFYTNGGVKLMEIFISSERAARRVIVFWARIVFKGKSEAEPVKGGASTQIFAPFVFPSSPLLTANVDVQANSGESHGRITGEIFKEGLDMFDLARAHPL
jgi:hypothetical protein